MSTEKTKEAAENFKNTGYMFLPSCECWNKWKMHESIEL